MRRKKKVIFKGLSFARCCLISLGMLLAGLPVYVLNASVDRASWPDWFHPLMVGMLLLGLFVLAAAVSSSEKTVESWLNAGTQCDASIILLILAAPLYFAMKLLAWRPKNKKNSKSK
jgi:peptidoglycan/LPS O-acetylase OafA/YrhL